MSSVQTDMKCPKCGGYMICDLDCRFGSEHRVCYRCGFEQSFEHLQQDEPLSESTGYGVLCLYADNGVGRITFLKRPLTDTDKAAIMADIQDANIVPPSYVVLYDPDSGAFSVLAGELPPSYDEMLEEVNDG